MLIVDIMKSTSPRGHPNVFIHLAVNCPGVKFRKEISVRGGNMVGVGVDNH